MRNIDIGMKVYCKDSGVIGTVLRFYNPTSCEEQTMVQTTKGKYHAPTSTWEPYKYGKTASSISIDECHIGMDLSNGPDMTATTSMNKQGLRTTSIVINTENMSTSKVIDELISRHKREAYNE